MSEMSQIYRDLTPTEKVYATWAIKAVEALQTVHNLNKLIEMTSGMSMPMDISGGKPDEKPKVTASVTQ